MIHHRAVPALALAVCVWAPAARALDLAGVLREVEAANPTLAASRAMAEAADRRVAPAGAWENPMLELGAINVPVGGGFDEDMMTMRMVGVSQRVPLSGANGLRRRAAFASADAARADAELTREQTLGAACEAYADAWAADRLAASATAHRGVMERLVEAARARYASGGGRYEEMLAADADRARLLADEAEYGGAARAARARLDALRGADPLAPSGSLEDPPAPALPPRADALVDPGSHPRLRSLDAAASRWRLGARAARRANWPDLQLSASWGYRGVQPDGMKPKDMWSATVGLMVPVFAGSREGAESREMDAMARAADAERRAGALDLAQQLAAAHAEAVGAARMVRLLEDTTVVLQRRAHDAIWSAYIAGRADLSRVLDTDHALYAEEQSLIRARQTLLRATGRLVGLTGRTDLAGVAPAPANPKETR